MPTQFTTEVVSISPADATRFLARNTTNRPLGATKVATLADAIRRGEWKCNGEAIKFAPDGTLLDGQHRLAACVKAGVAITTLVVRGVPKDTFDTMDQGSARTAANILAIAGEKNYAAMAAAARLVHLLSTDPPDFSGTTTPQQIENCIRSNPGLREWVERVKCAKNIVEVSVLGGLAYLFSTKDPLLAEEFVARLGDGVALSRFHPIMTLRDRLIANKASITKLPRKVLVAYIIKAWNAVRAGQQMRICKHSANEEFPKVQ